MSPLIVKNFSGEEILVFDKRNTKKYKKKRGDT